MTQRSGVTPSSAGTPKLSMKSEIPPPGLPLMEQPPFTSALEPEPIELEAAIDSAVDAVAEDDPFGGVALAEPEPGAFENPFAELAEPPAEPPPIPDVTEERVDEERAQLETMHANASAIVTALEAALERARENERVLAARLAR
jgi:hypothetical protein